MKRGDRGQRLSAEPILRLWSSRQDASIRAGDVQREQINEANGLPKLSGGQNFDGRVVCKSAFEIGVANRIDVGGENHRVRKCLGELAGLGASSGAEIENSLGL